MSSAPTTGTTTTAPLAHPLPSRPPANAHPVAGGAAAAPGSAQGQGGGLGPSHSSSVPTTPHQHARNFSFESREPSPNAAQNHSPRSAYSETNSTLPSLRPLPPRYTTCRFETAFSNSRRRMPYRLGSDRLPKVEPSTLKERLSSDEERRLTDDAQRLFDRLLPTPEVERRRKRLVEKLEKLLNSEWPGHDIRVQMFGSSGNLLCSDDSDGLFFFSWRCEGGGGSRG